MLKITDHVVNLYMHEVALHVDHNVEEFKPPFNEEALRGVMGGADNDQTTPTAAHRNALSACLQSIDGIFEVFLALPIDVIRCLPVANFVRVAYAVVVLIKMYFAAAQPNSGIGKVIDKDSMKVEFYLDGLVDLFQKSAAEEKSRPSGKFLMVLIMLKTWFHRQREGKPLQAGERAILPDAVTENGEKRGLQQGGQTGYNAGNTPLHLLSEVATGNPGGQSRSGSVGGQIGGSSDWQLPASANYASVNYPSSMQMGQPQYADSSFAMDFDFPLGDGMIQAVDMTFGGAAFGDFMGDNSGFLNGSMDPLGQNGNGF